MSAEHGDMTLATPCDACGKPLRREVVTLRFATLSAVPTGTSQAKAAPVERQEYLVCAGCASYVQACIAVLEGRVAAEPVSAREMMS